MALLAFTALGPVAESFDARRNVEPEAPAAVTDRTAAERAGGAAAGAGGPSLSAASSATRTGQWVSAYYAGWYWDWTGFDPAVAVAAVDMTTMTHFIFGRYAPGAGTQGGSAGQLREGAGTGHSQVEDPFIAKAHASGVKALAMLGGAGDGSGWQASTAPATRATFIKNILDKCVAKDYDGVDVDWEENLNTTVTQNQLIAFLTELRSAAAKRPRYKAPNAPFIITFPGFYVNINVDSIEPWKVTVASRVDQYNLMTYAMTYCCSGWDTWLWAALKGAGPSYPTSVESSIQAYVEAGVPRSKLGMGLGLYGSGYGPPVTGPRQAVSGIWGGDDNINNWEDFYNQGMFSGTDVTYHFDDAAQTGYYTYSPARSYRGDDVSMLITEDLQSIAAKGAWAQAGNVGGTIVWTINYGYVASLGGNPPMEAVKQAFLGETLPATSVDLRVTLQDSADPAHVGLPLTYTLTATNAHATRTATNVVATDTLPVSFSFASAGADCTFAAPKVTCALGSLGPGQQASRTITVTPTIAGTFTSAASTSASEPEETPADNRASEATTVLGAPTISVSDASVTEGNAGSVNAVFTVSLSAAFPASVTVGYTVTPLTAGPEDFTASTGTLVFPAGTTALPLPVPVQGDLLAETNETFLVTLVSSDHGTFAKSQGVGTILDDDPRPTVSITDASVTEGDIGYQVALLRVSLSAPAGMPVKVAYSTRNGTALAGRDYLPASGTLAFPEGTTTGELALWVVGGFLPEATKTFTVNLAQPQNATIAKGAAIVTIDDNDATPALAVSDVLIWEGNVGSRKTVFRVTLSAPAPADVSVDWTTSDLTAKAGEDYLPSGGTLTIKKGLRVGSLLVPVLGDRTVERNEAFLVSLSNAVGARIVDGQAQGVILNDDGARDSAIPIESLPYVVRRPGRYRLVGDLVFAPTQGAAVTIAANGVVLDLDGHTLSGSGGAITKAIGVLSRNRSIITVQNGTIQGFLAGVFLAGPPPYAVASRFSVLNLHVHSSTYAGIWLEGRGNQVVSCEVVGTGGTTALDPGAGAVGISSVGALPKVTQNQVLDTVASAGGDAFGIAANGATSGLVSGNLVRNTSSGAASGILVTRALKASVTLNTLDTLDYGIVFTAGARGTCKGNTMIGVATPTVGVACAP